MSEPFPTITLLNAVATTATQTSEAIDIRGLGNGNGDGLWAMIATSGFVAGTDFVGNIAILGGLTSTIADMRELPIVAADLIPVTLPTGLAVDSGPDGIDVANTLGNAGDITPVYIPFGANRPPFIAAKITRTSGGSSTAYFTIKVGSAG